MQKVAIIDMGTNTFHLMIATLSSGKFKILSRVKVPVKLGVGGINQDIITPEAMLRAIEAMKNFKGAIDQEGIKLVKAIGTSAMRNARNGKTVAQQIEVESGINVEIIDGLIEADFIYKGVRAAISMDDSKSLIMDIGGGSVEFIIGNKNEIFWSHSYELGGQRLLERFQKHDPILREEINDLNQYLEQNLESLLDAIEEHQPQLLLGSSGTFDTLSDIYCHENNIALEDKPETPFDISAFEKIYQQLINMNRAERMMIPGMIEMRVDMIVVACVLLKFILSKYAFKNIRVSSYSLKEGVLASLNKE